MVEPLTFATFNEHWSNLISRCNEVYPEYSHLPPFEELNQQKRIAGIAPIEFDAVFLWQFLSGKVIDWTNELVRSSLSGVDLENRANADGARSKRIFDSMKRPSDNEQMSYQDFQNRLRSGNINMRAYLRTKEPQLFTEFCQQTGYQADVRKLGGNN